MRCPPRGCDPTRRQYLRRAAGTVTAAGLAATAGCLGDVRDEIDPAPSTSADLDATPASALSASEWAEYVNDRREQYGDRGVWGTARDEPDHGLEFVGAWAETASLDVGESGGLRAVADAAAALYRTDRSGEAERTHYRCWLWIGGLLFGPRDGGLLAPTPELRRLVVGVALDGDGEMGPYAPATERTDGPVAVESPAPDGDGLRATFPLSEGTVGVDPEGTGFDEDAYAAEWVGRRRGFQSVNAVCELSWPADASPSFTFVTGLAADRRRL